MFRANDNFKSKWDLLIMLSAIFNCFSIPFKVAYNPPFMNSQSFAILNYCVDFVFFLDILVTFRTAFIDDYGNEIDTACGIALHYIQGQFMVDLCATIPFD